MINGKDTILLVQPYSASNGGLVVAELTENSHTIENELIDEQTKMGRILAYGQNSEAFELTAFGKRKDEGQKAVLNAIKNKEKLKVWEVDTVTNGTDGFDAAYAECFVESVEKSNPNDSFQEVTASLQVEGQSVDGVLTTLPAGATGNESGYAFEEPSTGI